MKNVFLIISLLSINLCYSQKQNIDSLLTEFNSAKHDSLKYNSALLIGNYYKNVNTDTAIYYHNVALKLAKKLKNEIKILESESSLAWDNYLKGNYKDALKIYNEALSITEKYPESNTKIQSIKAGILSGIGTVNDDQSDYPKALDYYFKSLKIHEKIDNKKGVITTYINIGNIYLTQEMYEKALNYYFKANHIAEQVGDKYRQSVVLGNIGVSYYNKKDLDTALEYYQKALELDESMDNRSGMSRHYGNIGLIYDQKGDIKKALEYYFRALELQKILGNKYAQSINLGNIGTLYVQIKEFKKAQQYLEESLKLSLEMESLDDISLAYRNLSILYEESNKPALALKYYKQYITYRDSVYNQQNSIATMEKEVQYQYDKKSAADSIAFAKEKEIREAEIAKQNAEIKVKKNQQFALFGGLLLISIFSVFIFNRFKITQRQKVIIENQKTEVESQRQVLELKNKEITQSIEYAQKIQNALLPSQEVFKKIFPDSFVLFKPKDIVSGDFYWISDRDDYTFYATADCTGHGVPGGFMSMLGTALLNEIIDERKISDCGEILNLMREKIIYDLRQSQDSESKDGMDMVLIRINKKTLQMQYSAANNSFYIVKNNLQLEELPCDKMPVGMYYGETKPFRTFYVQLSKGDIIYTLTDGYADQFGGEKGKKYTYKKLREKLKKINSENLDEQKNLLEKEFENWKAEKEQIDDVCMIGVKI